MTRKKLTLRLTEDQYKDLLTLKETLLFSSLNDLFIALISKNMHKLGENYYRKIWVEFNRQGNNLNQIARHLNSKNVVDNAILRDIRLLQEHYKNILDELNK